MLSSVDDKSQTVCNDDSREQSPPDKVSRFVPRCSLPSGARSRAFKTPVPAEVATTAAAAAAAVAGSTGPCACSCSVVDGCDACRNVTSATSFKAS